MTTEPTKAELIDVYVAEYDAGWNWAYDLKVGDTFRGSMGEGRARGLEGHALTAFHHGATSGLDGWKGIYTTGSSSRISKLEAK